jgi:AmmeMemoRadiSam system protein A
MTTEEERAALLRVARAAITAFVAGLPEPPLESIAAPERRAGVFVSLHTRGDLRGCIGHVEADRPLAPTIARCAVAAASSDPRFPPISAAELADLRIELSILGPLEAIGGADEIEVGRHGLIVEKGWRRGLLLPQVAVQWQWDRETFAGQTCHKAGLPIDAWKNGAALWRFEAEVFDDSPAIEDAGTPETGPGGAGNTLLGS